MAVVITNPSDASEPSNDDADWTVPEDAWPDGFDDPWVADWDERDPDRPFQYPAGFP